VLPLIALEEKVKEVPVVTVPVFVMASVGFAGIPTSQPDMKGEATARTSLGVRGMSNAWGTALPVPDKMLSIVE